MPNGGEPPGEIPKITCEEILTRPLTPEARKRVETSPQVGVGESEEPDTPKKRLYEFLTTPTGPGDQREEWKIADEMFLLERKGKGSKRSKSKCQLFVLGWGKDY